MNKSSGNIVCIVLVEFGGAVSLAGVNEEMAILMRNEEMLILIAICGYL
jgi:hypothetical protein